MNKQLLLLHGALGAGAQLEPLAARLRNKGFDPLVYEFEGHGSKSAAEPAFTLPSLAHDLMDFVRGHFTEAPAVFGYSMGGYAALYIETLQPGTFSRIVTLGTKFSWSPEEAERETRKLDPGFLLEKAPAYCQYLQQLHHENWKTVLDKTAGLMRALGENPLLTGKNLSAVNVPVHLLLGSLDKMVTPEETAVVHERIKDSKHEIIEGFVHPLERLDEAQLAEVLALHFSAH